MAEQDMGWWFLKTVARKARNASGKSQREVGDEIYRSDDTIRGWEKGKTDIPLQSIEPLAKACGMSDELTKYMTVVAEARKQGLPIEADMRYNVLFITLAEEYSPFIFKWDALLIPGPLQQESYHYRVVRMAENAADEALDRGWASKTERREILESRTDGPLVQFLIGEAALLLLKEVSEELCQEQLAHLKEYGTRSGWEVRILREPVPARNSAFSIYNSGGSGLACPDFVYTEGHDRSWCIDDPSRVTGYDDFREQKWKTATRIEDYQL
ncbi:Scr1 family TA system antitoxin-like transcriptional regulator [Glycomyces xiaoerkulensis]|uniref:Scr1 family TA system antitoxin-like transcriptional regulator n=1 Tax=Glycomyces xiaoerkulensis TaxID=2038139 RepID=UPI0013000786|nr:Scr1 family TA system antitoxin-like transcriptional regulator [Glycomyces xiaoerkulensis]